jgi:hypothetical protein
MQRVNRKQGEKILNLGITSSASGASGTRTLTWDSFLSVPSNSFTIPLKFYYLQTERKLYKPFLLGLLC